MKAIGIFLFVILLTGTAVAGTCTAKVRVKGSGFDGNNFLFTVTVYASNKESARQIFYSVDGNYKAEIPGGLGVPPMPTDSIFNSTNSIRIEDGDDSADDDISIAVGLRPIGNPKLTSIRVDGCFTQ